MGPSFHLDIYRVNPEERKACTASDTGSGPRQSLFLWCSFIAFPMRSPHFEKKSNLFLILFHKDLLLTYASVTPGLLLPLRSRVRPFPTPAPPLLRARAARSCSLCPFSRKVSEGLLFDICCETATPTDVPH